MSFSIHLEYWHLLGILWTGAYYFAMRLTFGCKSNPKIFDYLSEALFWILTNNYKLSHHMVSTLSSQHSMNFKFLCPQKKLALDILGFIFDSVSLRASLPNVEIHQIPLVISNFFLA